MTRLVRGSKDRLRLDWKNGEATGPDGTSYMIQTETVRGEGAAHYAIIRRPVQSYKLGETGARHIPAECPYGFEASVRDQKKMCEWDAWVQAGMPS